MVQDHKAAASRPAGIKATNRVESFGVSWDANEDWLLRRQLLSRMAGAGTVILGLLGGLAIFDLLSPPRDAGVPKMAATPFASSVGKETPKSESESTSESPSTRLPPLGSDQADSKNAHPALGQELESDMRHFVPVGVFKEPRIAQDLVSKLHSAGIPAQIESSVQVGPFATREQADAASAKLKTIGYGYDDAYLVRRK